MGWRVMPSDKKWCTVGSICLLCWSHDKAKMHRKNCIRSEHLEIAFAKSWYGPWREPAVTPSTKLKIEELKKPLCKDVAHPCRWADTLQTPGSLQSKGILLFRKAKPSLALIAEGVSLTMRSNVVARGSLGQPCLAVKANKVHALTRP